MSKGLQIAIGAALVAGLLGWYGLSQVSEGGFVYYQTLAEFRAGGEPGQAARVHGFVVPGSIERDVAAQQVSFRVQETAPHAGRTKREMSRAQNAARAALDGHPGPVRAGGGPARFPEGGSSGGPSGSPVVRSDRS